MHLENEFPLHANFIIAQCVMHHEKVFKSHWSLLISIKANFLPFISVTENEWLPVIHCERPFGLPGIPLNNFLLKLCSLVSVLKFSLQHTLTALHSGNSPSFPTIQSQDTNCEILKAHSCRSREELDPFSLLWVQTTLEENSIMRLVLLAPPCQNTLKTALRLCGIW